MTGWDLVVIGACLLAYAGISRRTSGSPITAAIVFTTLGVVIGDEVLGLLQTEVGSGDLRLLAEVTLALVLFSDASSLDIHRLRRQAAMPARLLAIALPLTIGLGAVVAIPLFDGLGVFEALALAAVLAPTDAALGQTVVSDRRLPTALRQGLNVESGLNDGVRVPIVVAAVAFAELEELPTFDGGVIVDLVKEVSVGLAVGLVVAVGTALLVHVTRQRGWMSREWATVVPLATVAIAYSGAVELHGSGFIGAFVGGLVFGGFLGERAHATVRLDEELGQLLSAVTFLLLGAVMVARRSPTSTSRPSCTRCSA